MKIDNVFSDEEIQYLNNIINDIKEFEPDEELGRHKFTIDKIGNEFAERLIKLVNNNLSLSSVTYVEYSNKFGKPNLPPHFDGDSSELILNYQLSSNTVWDLGLNTSIYKLEDNSAILFDPNKNIHWRPIKDFKDGEYVKMIFFRFCDQSNQLDNSHLRYSLGDIIYKEVREFRERLNEQS